MLLAPALLFGKLAQLPAPLPLEAADAAPITLAYRLGGPVSRIEALRLPGILHLKMLFAQLSVCSIGLGTGGQADTRARFSSTSILFAYPKSGNVPLGRQGGRGRFHPAPNDKGGLNSVDKHIEM